MNQIGEIISFIQILSILFIKNYVKIFFANFWEIDTLYFSQSLIDDS